MNLIQYTSNIQRTWNTQTPATDFFHCCLGLTSEYGELANAYKKQVGYNRVLDTANIFEELGDLMYFSQTMNLVIDKIIQNPSSSSERSLITQVEAFELATFKFDKHPVNCSEINILHDHKPQILLCELGSYVNEISTSFYVSGLVDGEDLIKVLEDEKSSIALKNVILSIQLLICFFAVHYSTTIEKIMEGNIAKLKARFPQGFIDQDCLVRDTEKEMSVLQDIIQKDSTND